MAPCPVSVRLALPNILRSVFPSELTSHLSATGSPGRHFTRPLRQLQFQHSQQSRPFTSNPRLLLAQNDNDQPAAPKSDAHPPESPESTPQLENTPDSNAPPQKDQAQTPKSRETGKSREKKSKGDSKNPKYQKESDKEKTKDKKHDKAKKVPKKPKKPEAWEIQKDALGKKFPDGWNPAKRLSPDSLDGIRHLHATAPDRFTTAVLAEEFKVSPEAIRRILKSKWKPSEKEMDKRRVRWENRHERIWSQMAELGLRPPTKRSQPLSDSKGLFGDKKK